MATLLEASTAAGAGLGAGLQGAVGQLSAEQLFTFTLYSRVVLPVDGFVFWAPATSVTPPASFTVNGSLHVKQNNQQETDAFYSLQQVDFTTKQQITAFEQMSPGTLYVMTLPNGTLLAFNGQSGRYDQAAIWHYVGRALLPFEASQVLASAADLPTDPIVSNSLPLWLAMSTYALPVFPAFLSPQNFADAYVTADVQMTRAMAMSPLVVKNSTRSQLVSDTVRFTFYGTNNDQALDFQFALLQNSLGGNYGVMSSPVPVDEKRAQSEFGIIAQKKAIDLQVSYDQTRVLNVAQKLILSATIAITPL